jgi:hypothetical protein
LRVVPLFFAVKWQKIWRSLTNCQVFFNSLYPSPPVGDVGRITGKRTWVTV